MRYGKNISFKPFKLSISKKFRSERESGPPGPPPGSATVNGLK